ncbi:phosphate ABC transporter permease PstA [Methanosalsum natronophilum]|uniref:Phosphate transport system permease protein PstA n=1 Tax=Methanosalsum natronophilum TaxID=768733 RepID=A0A3R7XUY5_9EURY|nr:phosphate ABC transporter permease PstA [Methanosalsum natronophilum]MCS3924085.1 phosphate transport system permease protein [Methanosalsum natronophilum]RQD86746.1 MAG: phosphate ABC transporter permease PstA [Methanosalsum natronophilum]
MSLSSRTNEKLAFTFIGLSMLTVVASVLIILYFIISNGYTALSWEFLTSMPRSRMTEGGIFPAIVGTVLLIVFSMLASLPMGVLAAIYLNEYSKPGRFKWAIEMAINNLAGTPSVVFGLFGLALFVRYFGFGSSVIAASLTLGILVLPVIVRASQEALLSVPMEYRHASLALGVSRWETVRKIVLPTALPGIVTGSILSIGRVAGETAPILFTGAAYFIPQLPSSIFDRFMALPYHLYVLATDGVDIEGTRHIQYGTALVLLLVVLGVNTIAILIRRHYRRKLRLG